MVASLAFCGQETTSRPSVMPETQEYIDAQLCLIDQRDPGCLWSTGTVETGACSWVRPYYYVRRRNPPFRSFFS